ncbi:hypothetical protein [Salinimicrobium gaetbulicola]|uniref:Uncharacterized protein n=1 Tax=Salinimicrobium gaetbulicola TaxID=999702 RepID=A0ABW3IBT6_9FLAO
MKKINLILLVLMAFLQSCNDDKCNDILCFTPPESFLFEIVDKTSGENLFTNGTYDSGDISITDALNNNEPVEFTFKSDNDRNLIEIGSIGWETEIVNLKIDISDDHIFDLYVDAERKMGDCCDYTEYKEITIGEAEFEFDAQTGIYKILVETEAKIL